MGKILFYMWELKVAYIVKNEQGKAKIYENKLYKRSVGSNVITLDWNDEWVVCRKKYSETI